MFSLNPLPAALKLEMPSEAFLHASLISIYKPYKSKQRGWILKSYAKIQQIIKFCKFFCTKSTFFYKKMQKNLVMSDDVTSDSACYAFPRNYVRTVVQTPNI